MSRLELFRWHDSFCRFPPTGFAIPAPIGIPDSRLIVVDARVNQASRNRHVDSSFRAGPACLFWRRYICPRGLSSSSLALSQYFEFSDARESIDYATLGSCRLSIFQTRCCFRVRRIVNTIARVQVCWTGAFPYFTRQLGDIRTMSRATRSFIWNGNDLFVVSDASRTRN